MLPPVTTTLGSDGTFSNLPAPHLAGTQVASAGKLVVTQEGTSNSSLFAKASLSALSSQLQFAQNVTVLADAIGKLINLPKHEGEIPKAYVTRLVNAINSMSQAQRAALDVQIAKILPGLSLSILADTLKNPTGPQAARLALLLETAPHRGSDLVAKAVVSSYRQNIGAEQRSNNGAPQPQSSGPQVQTSGNRPVQQAANSPALAPKSSAPAVTTQQQVPSANTPPPSIGGERPTSSAPRAGQPNSPPAPSTAVNAAAATPNGKDAPTAIQQNASTPPANTAPAAAQIARTHDGASRVIANSPAQGTITPAPSQLVGANAQTSTTPRPSPTLRSADGEAQQLPLSRRPSAAANDHATIASAPSVREGTASAVVNPIAALIGAISTAALPAAGDSNQSLFASLIGMVKSSIKDLAFNQTASTTSQNTEIDSILDELAHLSKNEIQNKLLEAIRHLPPDHPQVQALLMSALRNELVPVQPYVNYPSADDEYESESSPRGQWSSNGEDGAFDEQGEPEPDEETPDASVKEGPEEASPAQYMLDDDEPVERHAESYYLRMGNFL